MERADEESSGRVAGKSLSSFEKGRLAKASLGPSKYVGSWRCGAKVCEEISVWVEENSAGKERVDGAKIEPTIGCSLALGWMTVAATRWRKLLMAAPSADR